MKLQPNSSIFFAPVVASLLLCAGQATASTTGAVPGASPDAAVNQAMEQHKLGNWSHSYGRFAALADAGNAEAARIALFMLRHGSDMYGLEWGASQPQIEQWTKLALQPDRLIQVRTGE